MTNFESRTKRLGRGLLVLAAVATALALLISSSATAADSPSCLCAPYADRVQMHRSVLETSRVLEALDGRDLALRLRIEADDTIPAECRDYFVKKTRKGTPAQVAVRGHFGPQIAQLESTNTSFGNYQIYYIANFCRNEYFEYYNSMGSDGIPQPGADTAMTDCLHDSGKQKQYSELLKQIKDGDRLNTISKLHALDSADIARLRRLDELAHLRSRDELRAWAKKSRETMSSEEFLDLVQAYGGTMLDAYDDARADASWVKEGGAPGDTSLVEAANFNIFDFRQDKIRKKGVCRDIASVQGLMLKEFGFKNTVVTSFTTAGGRHATVTTQDPTRPGKAYRVDYYEAEDRSGFTGVAMLHQGAHDVTANYRLFKLSGHQVANLPSDFGKLMAEVMGLDLAKFDPMTKPNSDLVWARLSLGDDHESKLGIFAGKDGMGTENAGVVYRQEYANSSHFPGTIALLAGFQNRDKKLFGTDQQIGHVQIGVEQNFLSPRLKLAENTGVTINGHALAVAAVKVTHSERSGTIKAETESITEGDIRTGVDVQIDQSTNDEVYKGVHRVGVSVSPSTSDVRKMKPTVALNDIHVESTNTVTVGDDVNLVVNALVAMNELGIRGRATVGVAGETWNIAASVGGRLTDDTALYMDGSIRTATLALNGTIDDIRAGVMGEVGLEDDPERFYQIMAKVGVGF